MWVGTAWGDGRRGGCHCWECAAEADGGPRLGHTCKSFGPKLFIWFLLSATSVSSVRLCPLSLKRRKKKKKKGIFTLPPPPYTRRCTSLWATRRIAMTTNRTRGHVNSPSTLTPPTLSPLQPAAPPGSSEEARRRLATKQRFRREEKQSRYLSLFLVFQHHFLYSYISLFVYLSPLPPSIHLTEFLLRSELFLLRQCTLATVSSARKWESTRNVLQNKVERCAKRHRSSQVLTRSAGFANELTSGSNKASERRS